METLDTNVKILQKDIISFQQMLEKYDTTIAKITDVMNKFDKIIAVQEYKLENQGKSIEI